VHKYASAVKSGESLGGWPDLIGDQCEYGATRDAGSRQFELTLCGAYALVQSEFDPRRVGRVAPAIVRLRAAAAR
jgi:hypothetical protein